MDGRLLHWILRRSLFAYPLAFVAAYLVNAVSSNAPWWIPAFSVPAAFLWSIHVIADRTNSRALTTLPVARRRMAITFWFAGVVVLPLTFAAGMMTNTLLGGVVVAPDMYPYVSRPLLINFFVYSLDRSNDPTVGLAALRAVLVMGIAACYSLFSAFFARVRAKVEVLNPVWQMAAICIPGILTLGVAAAFASLMAPDAAGSLRFLGSSAAVGVVLASFRLAEPAWLPKAALQIPESKPSASSCGHEQNALPSTSFAACLHVFWYRNGRIGALLWLMYLAILYSLKWPLGNSDDDHALLHMFVFMALLMVAIVGTMSLPNMRSFRMLPLSRGQQAFLILSLPLSTSASAVILVPIAAYLFGAGQSMAAALLMVLAGTHMILTTAVLRWGYRAASTTAVITMFVVVAGSMAVTITPSALFAAAFILAAVSSGYTYYLVGNSSRIYQRKSPMEEMMAKLLQR